LQGEKFEKKYDKLLIATGAQPVLPGIPGVQLPGVMAAKTLEDGRRIKDFLSKNSVRSVVIIGMGYIALEMCENLRRLGLEVSMLKPNPRFLPWLDEKLAAGVKEEVEANGVNVYAGCEAQGIEKGTAGLKIITPQLDLKADMVLVAAGVTPSSQLAETAGLDIGVCRSIAVDRSLRTSDPDVYAAGDCADAYHVVTGDKTWIPLALRANRAGWGVADHIGGKAVELDGVAGTAVFRVFNLEVARTGLNLEEARDAGFDPVHVQIESRSRAHGHPGSNPIRVHMIADKSTGRLLGVQMVGRDGVAHRINGPAVALHGRMSVERFSQTDLAYAPPFGPTWDPMLVAANQLLKKL
jgi:NADPH-dependent 2,4-dienoyl-CoA reductase/sulfur reductase-like enzyme